MAITPETLQERAAALVPILAERAAETERQRQVPAQSVAELTEAGLFRVLQPKRFGGHVETVDTPPEGQI